jgi:opacity protein-like surface antigen
MRKLSIVLAIMVFFCVGAFAQTDSKADVFGGYQFTSVDDSLNGNGHVALNGWNTSVTGYLKPNFGITADISGAYGTPNEFGFDVKTSDYFYLFGPTFRTTGNDRASLFAHALFGAAHAKGDIGGITATDNAFAMAFGGGLDLKSTKNISLRVGQFDYLYSHFSGEKQNNFRYSAGVVFHF